MPRDYKTISLPDRIMNKAKDGYLAAQDLVEYMIERGWQTDKFLFDSSISDLCKNGKRIIWASIAYGKLIYKEN